MRAAIHITSSKFIKTLLVFVVCFIFSSAALVSDSFALNNQLLGDDWYLYRHTSGNPMCAMNTFDVNARRQSVGDNPWYLDAGVFAYWSCADSNNSAISAQQGDIIVVELNTNVPLSPYWYNTSARYLFSAVSGDIQTIYYYSDGFNSSVEFGWTFNPEGDIYRAIFRIQSINFYRMKASPPSYETALNNIQGSLGTVNNNLNTVNNNLNTVNNNLEDIQETQEQANDDANDRYQDEKDTISGNGDDAQDSADSLSINFGVPWILQAWFSLFVDDSCASIPTISSWIHSTETRICTPWPSAVRATLTPIFAVISGLLLFGFVIRWLRGGMFNNSIEVG